MGGGCHVLGAHPLRVEYYRDAANLSLLTSLPSVPIVSRHVVYETPTGRSELATLIGYRQPYRISTVMLRATCSTAS